MATGDHAILAPGRPCSALVGSGRDWRSFGVVGSDETSTAVQITLLLSTHRRLQIFGCAGAAGGARVVRASVGGCV